MRRAAAALLVTALAVVWLARYETRPPATLNPNSSVRATASPAPGGATGGEAAPAVTPEPVRRSGTLSGPGVAVGEGPVVQTPFSVIQVRAALRDGRLVGVETVALSGADAHTDRLNARAEPVLRAGALEAGSAEVDVVTGATYTSESWRESLQAAILEARRG